MNSFEITLDVRPDFPLSEIEKLSRMLTYINMLSAKIEEDSSFRYSDSTLSENSGTLPLLTVTCCSPKAAHGLFSDERYIEKLSEHLAAGEFWGVNFCFLRLFPFDRDSHTRFLEKCVRVLHEKGYSVGSIVAPPCALSISSANDYKAMGNILDRVNFFLSDCIYRKESFKKRLSDSDIAETLDFAGKNIPSGKLAVTLADHGLSQNRIVPNALARRLNGKDTEYDDEKSYKKLFRTLSDHGVTGISIRPCLRADSLIFAVLSENHDIIKL